MIVRDQPGVFADHVGWAVNSVSSRARPWTGALLLITKSGSHVAFNEGPFGRKSFHTRVSLDFLDAARELAAAEAANSEAGTAELRGVVVPTALGPRPPAAAGERKPRRDGREQGEPGREARPPSIRKVGVV